MKQSIKQKLYELIERQEEILQSLSDVDVIKDQNKFRSLSKEYAQLEPFIQIFKEYEKIHADIQSANEILKEKDSHDSEIKEMVKEELTLSRIRIENLSKELEVLLLPKDPKDNANIFLEIRAGTGGKEAAIFAGDLFKTYSKYAETQKWHIEIINQHNGENGGFKEIISKITGNNVYSKLKFESGTHRVQRIPETESQGRIHTSACTVAVMPEADEINEIDINATELRIDTFRASGAGGQHVNKTDSAIRITHIPTGIVVECQEQRSQHKNRAQAISMLKAKILQVETEKQQEKESHRRKILVGSGDRSERIRTYNYPQRRVTEHRINLTVYKLEEIMQGDLDSIIQPLVQEYQTDLLTQASSKENDK